MTFMLVERLRELMVRGVPYEDAVRQVLEFSSALAEATAHPGH